MFSTSVVQQIKDQLREETLAFDLYPTPEDRADTLDCILKLKSMLNPTSNFALEMSSWYVGTMLAMSDEEFDALKAVWNSR